jgi:uncharacterized membrane protein YdcZ (DUF606 family)
MKPSVYIVVLTATGLMSSSLMVDGFRWVYSINRALAVPLTFSTLLIFGGLFSIIKK